MTEWGNRRLRLSCASMTVEEAELECAGEGEREENDQRGRSWKGRAHAGSVLPVSERVKTAERDVLYTRRGKICLRSHGEPRL